MQFSPDPKLPLPTHEDVWKCDFQARVLYHFGNSYFGRWKKLMAWGLGFRGFTVAGVDLRV